MWGTMVNGLAIVAGALLGRLLGKGLPENIRGTVMQALGLGVLLIGMQMAFATQNVIIVIISLVAGGITGEILRIEYWLNRFGERVQAMFARSPQENTFAQGFITASLVYCVGAMAIMGALESGLTGNHHTLYAKSVLDGVSAIAFASSLGSGVVFSALPVVIYQGSITLLASWLQHFMTAAVIAEMKATGGVLIFGIGLNILEIKTIKIGNMLPAILFAFFLAYLF